MSRCLLLSLLALLFAGCDDPCSSEEDRSVEVGTGEESFTPVEDGDVLPLAFGGQGGQHLWGAVRVNGVALHAPTSADPPTVSFGLEHPEGTVARWEPTRLRIPVGRDSLAGVTVILDGPSPAGTPFLYPDDFDTDLDPWPSEEEWAEAQETMDAELAGGLELWTQVVDRCGFVMEDSVEIGVSGGIAQGWWF